LTSLLLSLFFSLSLLLPCSSLLFLFSHPSSSFIYTLSLHDALPIYFVRRLCSTILFYALSFNLRNYFLSFRLRHFLIVTELHTVDRKSTPLNSSHEWISYAVFCLKKKNK